MVLIPDFKVMLETIFFIVFVLRVLVAFESNNTNDEELEIITMSFILFVCLIGNHFDL